jgi:hypothetical protein
MFISDRIVFLELQKTGCTHIRALLQELVGGKLVGKHNQASRRLFSGGKTFLGSVRDPWDWHVSLWAFGCHHMGSVYRSVTVEGLRVRGRGWTRNPFAAFGELVQSHPNRNVAQWRRTYQDARDPGAFREWLQMMYDKDFRPDAEGYAHCSLSRVAGFLTYSYLKTFTCKGGGHGGLNSITTYDQLAQYEADHCFIDHFIRNEHLESDLLNALKLTGYGISADAEEKVLARPRTNVTSRKRTLDYYYDAGTEKLVSDWDRLIVDKFGYAAPSTRKPMAAAIARPRIAADSMAPFSEESDVGFG